MSMQRVSFTCASPEVTSRQAVRLGKSLTCGDTLLLSGPVGAGKTFFARRMIQSLLVEPEDVPSPTFTLVQTYDTTVGPLWHCDLYRIGSTLEIEELGLIEAFDEAICLVEWPDRLGDLAPANGLQLDFAEGRTEDSRAVRATWSATRWDGLMAGWAAK